MPVLTPLRDTMARFLYTLLFSLLLPFMVLRLLMRAFKAPAYAKRINERFGLFKLNPAIKPDGMCFHTVSVGEFIAATPLIEQVMQAHSDRQIIITTTTPTGSAQVQKHFANELGKRVFHVYLPYDIPLFLNVFFRRLKPRLLVILETELWPNLIHACHKNNCKVMVANARLSEKSAKGYAKFSNLSKSMLEKIDCLAVQNKTDGGRFIEVGLPKNNMTVTGSIKFDLNIKPELLVQGQSWREQWGSDRNVVIVASTHNGEDEIALAAFKEVLKQDKNTLLILVPRHPERFGQVAKLIAGQSLSLVRRSENSKVNEHTQVLLVDTMGELMQFLAASDICIMGGSFVPNGGHNPLEPAALGVPIIMGPSQFNFALICQQLEQASGLISLTEKELSGAVIELLNNNELRKIKGESAKKVLDENRGAKQKVFELISEFL